MWSEKSPVGVIKSVNPSVPFHRKDTDRASLDTFHTIDAFGLVNFQMCIYQINDVFGADSDTGPAIDTKFLVNMNHI